MRVKLAKWGLPGPPGTMARRALRRLQAVASHCPPRVQSAVFRTWWNGWTTTRRMRHMTGSSDCGTCKLGCEVAQDSLEHYCQCPVFWQWALSSWPRGLGLAPRLRSRASFFPLEDGMSVQDIVRMSSGIYAIFRAVSCGGVQTSMVRDARAILYLWRCRANE